MIDILHDSTSQDILTAEELWGIYDVIYIIISIPYLSWLLGPFTYIMIFVYLHPKGQQTAGLRRCPKLRRPPTGSKRPPEGTTPEFQGLGKDVYSYTCM